MVLPETGYLSDESLNRLVQFFERHTGIVPHTAQCDLLRHRSRYKVLLCGRRWGKTLYLALELLWYIHWFHELGHPRPRIRLVAPEYSQIREVLNYLQEFCVRANLPLREVRDPRDPHYMAGNVRLEPRSAKNRVAHRGPGLSLVVIDEARDIDPSLYYYSIAPSLSDYLGHVLIASTPNGLDWVVQLAERQGVELPYMNLHGFHLISSPDKRTVLMRSPTWSNPHIPSEEIEVQRQILPSEVFAQEYCAEILVGYMDPFIVKPQFVDGFTADDEQALEYAEWVIGVDYGYKSPSAVLLVAYCPDGIIRVPYVGYETYIDEVQFTDWVRSALRYKVGQGPILAIIGDADFGTERGRRNLADCLRGLGYPVLFGIRDRIARWARLRECLNGLTIRVLTTRSGGLVSEFQQARPHRVRMGDIEKPDHALTAFAYALDYLGKRRPPLEPLPPMEDVIQHEIWSFYQKNVVPIDEHGLPVSRQGHRIRHRRPIVMKRRWN